MSGDSPHTTDSPSKPGDRWIERAVWVALALLLFYPIHVPYQNPDQDFPPFAAAVELVRGDWSPFTVHYPSGLTNLLRVGYALALRAAAAAGHSLTPGEWFGLWHGHPQLFRVPPRLIAMLAGIWTLLAVRNVTRRVTDARGGLIAAVLLGTTLMFVREHHHGMFDAPASAAMMATLALAATYVAEPRRRTFVASAVLAGLATGFKWNAAVVALGPLVALGLARVSVAERTRLAVLAALAGALAFIVTTPAIVLEPARVVEELHMLYALFVTVAERWRTSYRFTDALRNGIGLPLLAAAALGFVRVLRNGERTLLPLASVTVAYAIVTWRNPLVLNRYVLPLAAPLAVLATYGLYGITRPRLRLALAVAIIAVDLPVCLIHLRLLGTIDTRVAAARWLREHVRPEARVYFPTEVLLAQYFAPDLPRPLWPPPVPAATLAELQAHLVPLFPSVWRYFSWKRSGAGAPTDAERLAPYRGGIIVTSELPDGPFADPATAPPEAIALLTREATLLLDLPSIARDGIRVYEPGDLNAIPIRGAWTLSRPGPHVRVWYVPDQDAATPSPFVDGQVPSAAGPPG